jgi:hypothetical protein
MVASEKKNRVISRPLKLAISTDEELNKLLSEMMIFQGKKDCKSVLLTKWLRKSR